MSRLFLIAGTSLKCSDSKKEEFRGVAYPLSAEQEAFLDTLQYRTFQYFLQETNPENGLVKDRSSQDSPASTAAMGFAIGVWAVGAERGWISRQEFQPYHLCTGGSGADDPGCGI